MTRPSSERSSSGFSREWPATGLSALTKCTSLYWLPAVKKETILTSAKYEGGVYTLSVERTLLGKYKYVDYAKVTRVTGTVAK